MVAVRLVADGGLHQKPGVIKAGVQAEGIICMHSVQWPESVCQWLVAWCLQNALRAYFRLTCFTCFTCCKGKWCYCGFLFGVCDFLFVLFGCPCLAFVVLSLPFASCMP